jgi:hypothetical protein
MRVYEVYVTYWEGPEGKDPDMKRYHIECESKLPWSIWWTCKKGVKAIASHWAPNCKYNWYIRRRIK